MERVEGLKVGTFHLTKRLPVAAGIGGGSSDAAAALRLLARLNGLPLSHAGVREAARLTGADVPVCLEPTARMMRGVGEAWDLRSTCRACSRCWSIRAFRWRRPPCSGR